MIMNDCFNQHLDLLDSYVNPFLKFLAHCLFTELLLYECVKHVNIASLLTSVGNLMSQTTV